MTPYPHQLMRVFAGGVRQALEQKRLQQVKPRRTWQPVGKGKGDGARKGKGKKGGRRGKEDIVGSDVEVGDEAEAYEDVLARALRGRLRGASGGPLPSNECQRVLGDFFKKQRVTYTDLGRHLLESLIELDTPLGRFVRTHCSHVQPPPATEATYPRRGDLLPIHPSTLVVGEQGVTEQNVDWLKLTVTLLSFKYCIGWTKPICVPMDCQLSENQKLSIQEMARTVNDNILSADQLPTTGRACEALQSKRYDYSGNPVEYMEDLVAEKVFPTWPRRGEAGVRCITDFLDDEGKEAMRDPKRWLFPLDRQPPSSKRSLVRASDKEWLKICKEGYVRGMFCMVNDADVPRDKAGHLVVNGAGGVKKVKVIDSKGMLLQRFISVLIPTNEMMMDLPGAQDTLPYVGQLTALYLSPAEELFMESEDLQSAFNLFRVPPEWSPCCASRSGQSAPGSDRGAHGLEVGGHAGPSCGEERRL